MANNNWAILKNAISEVIRTNGAQEITGEVLQNILVSIVNTLGENATFAGAADESTNPGVPNGPVFYIAAGAGIYSNFGNIEISDGEIAILRWSNQVWSKEVSGFASHQGLVQEAKNRQAADTGLTNMISLVGTGSITLDEMLDFNPLSDDGKSFLAGYLDKPSRYVVTAKGNGTYDYPVNVGILEIISDSSQHVYTQKFTTHYVLNEGTFDGTHDDARLRTYYRSYSVDSPVLEPGWSAWQEKTVYKLESRLADVEKVTASLPSDIVGLSTIQSLLLSKVGNIVICEEDGFFVIDSEGHIGAMVTTEKSSGFGSDVEYIRQSDVEYN